MTREEMLHALKIADEYDITKELKHRREYALRNAIVSCTNELRDRLTEAIEENNELSEQTDEAISLLKQCVNWDDDPMQTGISGELGDRIKEFIGRCGE